MEGRSLSLKELFKMALCDLEKCPCPADGVW
jgi:hypothetical protein